LHFRAGDLIITATMPPPKITLREVTQETLDAILRLEVHENQRQFVATNAKSVAQAHFEKKAWFRAIYADDIPVGFVMLYIDTEKPAYWVWRFMVDKNHQKNNYGYEAMRQVIEHVKTFPEATELFLSFHAGEGDPSGFYAKFGFVETGEIMEGQNVMRLAL